jgi:hypothetical protein
MYKENKLERYMHLLRPDIVGGWGHVSVIVME